MSGTLHIIKSLNNLENTNLSFYHSKNLPKKHNHIFFNFKNFSIVFNDPRRFGFLKLIKGEINLNYFFKKLGPDPFSKNFNFNGVNAGPAVRKYARELEINLDKITGTGKNGRITKDDLKSYIHSKILPEINYPDPKSFEKFGEFSIEKQTKIRALGSKNMSDSWTRIPHVTHFEEVEMTSIDSFRAKKKISQKH